METRYGYLAKISLNRIFKVIILEDAPKVAKIQYPNGNTETIRKDTKGYVLRYTFEEAKKWMIEEYQSRIDGYLNSIAYYRDELIKLEKLETY